MSPVAAVTIVSPEHAPPQPWRNGGGTTRELLAWPAGDGWRVRISVAEITRDGPFSAFPGIERWFAVVQGPGVALRFGDRLALLGPADEALRFDGASPPWAELQGGATRDLNLMVQQQAGRGAMRAAKPGDEWSSTAPLRALFCAAAARLQVDDVDAARLPPGSLAWSAHAQRQRWRLLPEAEPVRAFWLSFEPRRT